MADERMPKLSEHGNVRKATLIEQQFMQQIEKKNIERVINLKRMRRNNKITGLILGAGVLGIYGYSIYAVRQERFLDDFDEPEKISD